jgi:hypothetical protein
MYRKTEEYKNREKKVFGLRFPPVGNGEATRPLQLCKHYNHLPVIFIKIFNKIYINNSKLYKKYLMNIMKIIIGQKTGFQEYLQ